MASHTRRAQPEPAVDPLVPAHAARGEVRPDPRRPLVDAPDAAPPGRGQVAPALHRGGPGRVVESGVGPARGAPGLVARPPVHAAPSGVGEDGVVGGGGEDTGDQLVVGALASGGR